ncbi:Serine/threonine-protein phosphatase 4 regulatory subunit 2-B [Zalerion maritima]|uniref:Serine/threonine-protein phosphatase 4 regulatory subunit 2-B n=1 Tax=Zalerion maritima TaxID=339359 RepID=A0AAD5RWP5_9PEZI|nr:Serine/threonine-protein phosphatase 4 regulatory subunit 2-B [Zalerion maritima]
MDVATQEQVLQQVADGGGMDYELWPRILPCVIERIELISRTKFRIPNLPSPSKPTYLSTIIPNSQPDPSGDKENAVPTSSSTTIPDSEDPQTQAQNQGVGGTADNSSVSSSTMPTEAPQQLPSSSSTPTGDSAPPVPPQIAAMVTEIIQTMNTTFPSYPPHTMQRLAELVLDPKRHYRNLIPYLHALDRVVHVTSGANVYPLPAAIPDMSALQFLSISERNPAALVNGTAEVADAPFVGPAARVTPSVLPGVSGAGGISWANATSSITPSADEAQLGGALLTPIPWLARQAEEAAAAAAATANASGTDSSPAAASSPGSTPTASSRPATAGGGTPPPGSQGATPPSASSSSSGSGAASGAGGGEFRTESTETIDGPNGMGSIETVSINLSGGTPPVMPAGVTGSPGGSGRGVTQGELLRQEQRAGVVPKTQLDKTDKSGLKATSGKAGTSGGAGGAKEDAGGGGGGDRMDMDEDTEERGDETTKYGIASEKEKNESSITATHDANTEGKETSTEGGNEEGTGEEGELPHARGPEEIGDADLGPQKGMVGVEMHGIDVEAAVGRKAVTPPGSTESGSVSKCKYVEGIEEEDDSEDDAASKALSPKREAEEELDGLVAKRVKTEEDKKMEVEASATLAAEDKSEEDEEKVKVEEEGKMDVDKPETASKTETEEAAGKVNEEGRR